jgi:hypothetical protein
MKVFVQSLNQLIATQFLKALIQYFLEYQWLFGGFSGIVCAYCYCLLRTIPMLVKSGSGDCFLLYLLFTALLALSLL